MLLVGSRNQTGFTLIEIMVVIIVVALITAMSVVAVNQAGDRRYSSEAEKLLIWLNQLSEFSAMQGAAFGIVAEPTGKSKSKRTDQLRATIYYRNQWVAVAFPEPFILDKSSKIKWLMDDTQEKPLLYQQAALPTREEIEEGTANLDKQEEDFLEPEMAFLPDGYVEPEGRIELSFDNAEKAYNFYWDDKTSRMLMESKKQ